MTQPRYIDIHAVQTVPYANLNRDDLGSPKSVAFGGEDRIRVSSQCWKRAVRLSIQDHLGDSAIRTRRVPERVAAVLDADGWSTELAAFAGMQVAASAGKGLQTEEGGETSVLLYLPENAITELARLCQQHREALEAAFVGPGSKKSKKTTAVLPNAEINRVLSSRNGIISLFGRMLAELPASEVDGAVQVAHAFTTHGAAPQIDFFTAVDDLQPAAMRGSGHMNSAEFSAGVFYRYASVNVEALTRNLGDGASAQELASAFLNAFITAMPGAKKNSTAPFTVPDLVYVAVRADRPVSLSAAFEQPVSPAQGGGYSEPSRNQLAAYADAVYGLLGTDGLLHHAHAGLDDRSPALGERATSFAGLVESAVDRTAPAGAGRP